jgi:hypothetical protein
LLGIAVAVLVWMGVTPRPAAAQFPKETGEIEQKEGKTTAYASAKVSMQVDKGLIELWVKVKKTGINGTGYAYAQVALLDAENNTIFKSPILQKHKGASFGSGVATGQTEADYDVPLEVLNKTAKAILIVRAKDNDGFGDPVESLKKHLDNATELLKKGQEVRDEFMKLVGF